MGCLSRQIAGEGRARSRPPSFQLNKVKPQTDRCRQSPARAARVAGSEVHGSPAHIRDPRAPQSLKRAGGKAGKGNGCRGTPRPGPRHTLREIGEERSPFQGAATQPPPPRPLSPPTAPPLRPPRPRAAPPLRSAVHTVLFQQNNTMHRPPHPHQAGPGATPSPPPAGPGRSARHSSLAPSPTPPAWTVSPRAASP